MTAFGLRGDARGKNDGCRALTAIREAQAAGAKTLHEIAAALNGRGIARARGGKGHDVRNILKGVA